MSGLSKLYTKLAEKEEIIETLQWTIKVVCKAQQTKQNEDMATIESQKGIINALQETVKILLDRTPCTPDPFDDKTVYSHCKLGTYNRFSFSRNGITIKIRDNKIVIEPVCRKSVTDNGIIHCTGELQKLLKQFFLGDLDG